MPEIDRKNGRKNERKGVRRETTQLGLAEAEKVQSKAWIVTNTRDELLTTCVEFGLSLTDIYHFSFNWPSPIPGEPAFKEMSRVSERVESLGLRPLFWKRSKKRTKGHNESINKIFVRLVGQFFYYGFSLGPVTRETKASEISPVRPDFSFIVKREKDWQFFVEVQSSSSKYTNWKAKLRQYVKLREATNKRFFKILVIAHDEGELARSKEGARLVLRDMGHEGLNIFQFALLSEIETTAHDVVRGEIWDSCWPKMRKDSLLK